MVNSDSTTNPYKAPSASISKNNTKTYQPKIFTTIGRIGRLRYLAYLFGSYIVISTFYIALSILDLSLAPLFIKITVFSHDLFNLKRQSLDSHYYIISAVCYFSPYFVFSIIFTKRRLNHLSATGWLTLLLMIPILNFMAGLYLFTAPGIKKSNMYGLPSVPNTELIKLMAILLPFFSLGYFYLLLMHTV